MTMISTDSSIDPITLEFAITDVSEVLRLRQSVLWPDKPLSHVFVKGDENALHVCASYDGRVIGVGSFFSEGQNVQLRKFAVEPAMQGQGVGQGIVKFGIGCLQGDVEKLLWCDARVSALGFYQKLGFTIESAVFEKSGVSYQKATIPLPSNVRSDETNQRLVEFTPETTEDDNAAELTIATVSYPHCGHIGICRMPGLMGHFSEDLDQILNWGADVVVTMNTDVELRSAHSSSLGQELDKRGIEWIHLPISNYAGLTNERADEWNAIAAKLHTILKEGGRVLTHCRGGHGRSGMVSMRLLVESGEKAILALQKIRAARPGAVETREQFGWASMIEI